MPKKATGGTPATTVLAQSGVPHVLRTYRHTPQAPSFGMEAARELGVEPERVFKTLLVEVDGDLVVGIVPVDTELDLKALASAVGGKRAAMAAVERAERSTGYVAGGISPLGHPTPHPTILDDSALDHHTIFVSAGKRGLDVELEPRDLIDLTSARVARIGRRG